MVNNQLDDQYRGLLGSLLQAQLKGDRTGTGTASLFGRQIRHNMQDGFPLLTTKKVYMKGVQTELKWFLQGRTDIDYLRANNCRIWDGDYERSGRTDGSLGPIYGKQWRDWSGHDQLAYIMTGLEGNPDSRRLMVSAWNVGELGEMTLPPCHHSWQVWTRPLSRKEKKEHPNKERAISLMWNQRSVDTFLGLPFNIASYGTLLLLLAEHHNMLAYELIGSLGDVHLYENHFEAAWKQLEREPRELPQLKLENIDLIRGEWDWNLIDYNPHPAIKAPLNVG